VRAPESILIIANPAAGGVGPDLVWQVVRQCGRPVSLRWTGFAGQATDIAAGAANTADLVVSVGGDGTAREVAAGLATARRGVPMLIVPSGTANSLYRSLWGSTPWPVALSRALAGAPTRRLDLARLGGHLVLAGASAGFSAQVIHAAKSRGISYRAAIEDLAPGHRPYPGRVLVDDQIVHSGATLLANVGGSRYRGGEFQLLPHSEPDDGLLDVCVIGGEHRVSSILPLIATGTHLLRPGVVYARGRTVRVERTDGGPLWFEHDGEVLPTDRTSRTLTVFPAALLMVTAAETEASAA
jgi:diacylglycerol kinase (ATP)